MNARGSTEVIVASIGLSMGVLSQNLFTLIVAMAVITTMAMPPMLRWALQRLPLRKEERQRLEREELDAKGFVANLERLLLAVDDSANGKFASRLAGVDCGLRRQADDDPRAVVAQIAENRKRQRRRKSKRPRKQPRRLKPVPTKKSPAASMSSRAPTGARSAADVAEEAKRGYDLLIVGIGNTRNRRGGFSEEMSRLAKGFEGPLVIVDAGEQISRPKDGCKILIPVNGTERLRRAVEVGLTLARANRAKVTTLYVTRPGARGLSGAARRRVTRRDELAFLEDIDDLADRYEVDVHSTTRADTAPDEAILRDSSAATI